MRPGSLLALLLVATPARADEPPVRLRSQHELQAQDQHGALQILVRSTYALAPGERRLTFTSPVCWPLDVVAPSGVTQTRNGSGCVTELLVPDGGQALVVSGSQRARVEETMGVQVPLVGDGGLELIVVSGGDGAQLEPAEALGMNRHVGYLASPRVTEQESAAFGAWRARQPLRHQYLLVRMDHAGLDGRVTTKDSRGRPVVKVLLGVALVGALVLLWLWRRLAHAARGEEAEAIIARHVRD